MLDIWVSSSAGAAAPTKVGEGSPKGDMRGRQQIHAQARSAGSGSIDHRWGWGSVGTNPAASTLSTTLLAPPTVIDNALAMSSTRHPSVAATTCMISNQASGTPCAC